MSGAVLVAARRSAVAPRGGAFAHLSLEALSKPVLRAALQDARIHPEEVDEMIVSNALGAGGNPARIIALHAGLPEHVPGLTIDRQCAGGLDAIMLADSLIRSGCHQIVVAGGVESHSRRPLRYRTFFDGRSPEAYDQAQFTPWPDRDPDMAEAANDLARLFGITREEQDALACQSHAKALRHRSAAGGTSAIVEIDGNFRDVFARNLTPEICKRAKPVAGSVTAANMAVAADGAAFVVLTSSQYADQRGLRGVNFLSGVSMGAQPDLPGSAPVAAIHQLFEKYNIEQDQLSCVEIMEAFAAQAIVCQRGADLPDELVNRYGGALARGHPIGASGAILIVNLFDQLKTTRGYGLAAVAAAGGIGSAAILEQV